MHFVNIDNQWSLGEEENGSIRVLQYGVCVKVLDNPVLKAAYRRLKEVKERLYKLQEHIHPAIPASEIQMVIKPEGFQIVRELRDL